MPEVNLTAKYPKGKGTRFDRTYLTVQDRHWLRTYPKEFFDGDRKYGYGGYSYDGRWLPVARDFVEYYGLTSGSKVLDVGCAKGFFLHDLRKLLPGITVRGVDLSEYAIANALPDVKTHLSVCCASELPFGNGEFDLVVAIGSVYTLARERCRKAIRDIERIGKRKYIQVASWRSDEERDRFREWQLVSGYYDDLGKWVDLGTTFDTRGWEEFFREAGYTGEYSWTIIE